MKYFSPLLVFILGWALLLASNSLAFIGLTNGLLQLLLFFLVVCIPTWLTSRMSYVDIAWPWGLVLIGIVTLLFLLLCSSTRNGKPECLSIAAPSDSK